MLPARFVSEIEWDLRHSPNLSSAHRGQSPSPQPRNSNHSSTTHPITPSSSSRPTNELQSALSVSSAMILDSKKGHPKSSQISFCSPECPKTPVSKRKRHYSQSADRSVTFSLCSSCADECQSIIVVMIIIIIQLRLLLFK